MAYNLFTVPSGAEAYVVAMAENSVGDGFVAGSESVSVPNGKESKQSSFQSVEHSLALEVASVAVPALGVAVADP